MRVQRRLRYGMKSTMIVGAGLALTTCGCSRDPEPVAFAPQRPSLSFEAARARCGVTVAETADVQRCMRTQGWLYRLPWQ